MNGFLRATSAVFALVAAACSLQACGIGDMLFKPDPTIVKVKVKVATDVNPDSRNRASPVKTRFYLLTSVGVFKSANFFQLKEQDRELLGKDLMARKEQVFKPGEEQRIELSLPPEELSKDEKLYLAVMVGYWDIHNSEWRAVDQIRIEKTTKLIVSIARSEVSIEKPD